jgi:hypothetical protein
MPFIYLVSFIHGTDTTDTATTDTSDKNDIVNYAIISKFEINMLEILQVPQDNIIFNESICIPQELLDKVIRMYKGFNIVKITIVDGECSVWVDNDKIVIINESETEPTKIRLNKNINKNFHHIHFCI